MERKGCWVKKEEVVLIKHISTCILFKRPQSSAQDIFLITEKVGHTKLLMLNLQNGALDLHCHNLSLSSRQLSIQQCDSIYPCTTKNKVSSGVWQVWH